jgi:hypothetical protein
MCTYGILIIKKPYDLILKIKSKHVALDISLLLRKIIIQSTPMIFIEIPRLHHLLRSTVTIYKPTVSSSLWWAVGQLDHY